MNKVKLHLSHCPNPLKKKRKTLCRSLSVIVSKPNSTKIKTAMRMSLKIKTSQLPE